MILNILEPQYVKLIGTFRNGTSESKNTMMKQLFEKLKIITTLGAIFFVSAADELLHFGYILKRL